MCFGCSKEPSHWDGSFEHPQHMFWLRNKKNSFQLRTLSLRPVFLQRRYAKVDLRSACTFVFRSTVWLNPQLLKSMWLVAIIWSNDPQWHEMNRKKIHVIGSITKIALSIQTWLVYVKFPLCWTKTETFQSQSAPNWSIQRNKRWKYVFFFIFIWFFTSQSTIFQLFRDGSSWVEPDY